MKDLWRSTILWDVHLYALIAAVELNTYIVC